MTRRVEGRKCGGDGMRWWDGSPGSESALLLRDCLDATGAAAEAAAAAADEGRLALLWQAWQM
jgi:hypothetical protein